MSAEEIRKLLEAYHVQYNAFDFQGAVQKYYADDIVFESPLMKLQGKEAVLAWFLQYHSIVPSQLLPVNYVIGDNKAAVEQRVELDKSREVPDFLRPSLREDERGQHLRIITVYEFRDGLIARICTYIFFAGNVTVEPSTSAAAS